MKYLHLIWSNLKRHKLRTSLTILTIFIAFLLFGFLSAIEKAINVGVTLAGQDRLIVRHKVSIIQLLPISYRERIARIKGVDAVVHSTWFGGQYQDPANFFPKMPVEPDAFLDMFPEYVLTEEEIQNWTTTRSGAIVGEKLAKDYDFKIGDRVPIMPDIWRKEGDEPTWEFDIVGIYRGEDKNTDTSQMFFRYDYFDEARLGGKGEIGWYTVRVSDPDKAAEIAAAIDREFSNSPAETKSEAEGAFIAGFAKQIGDIATIMIGIVGAVFFTILLVAGNTIAQSVRERTVEIGVLKALGFSSSMVLVLVFAESILISGIGGTMGLTLSYTLISMNIPSMSGFFPVFYFPTDRLVFAIIMIFVLGLLTGFVPAIQAMRLHISEALRKN